MATIYWRPGGTVHQPGATAYLNWREHDRQWRRSLGKIEPHAAEKIRSAKAAELEHGVRILPRGPLANDYFAWYVEWYEAEHPTTAKRLKSELKPFLAKFGDKQIDSITAREIENWKVARLKTHAPETVGKELRRVKAALARGMAWKEIDSNPVEHVSAPRGVLDAAVDFYTADQIAKLYKAAPARAALWALAVNTGLRRGELAKATKADSTVSTGRSHLNHNRRQQHRLPHHHAVFGFRLLPNRHRLTTRAEESAGHLDGRRAVRVVRGDGADDAALGGQ